MDYKHYAKRMANKREQDKADNREYAIYMIALAIIVLACLVIVGGTLAKWAYAGYRIF